MVLAASLKELETGRLYFKASIQTNSILILKLKMMKKILLTPLLFFASGFLTHLISQPANEINCFRNFDVNATGRNDVNAYLLSQLSYLVYANQLAEQINVSESILQRDTVRFKAEFIKRTKHFFYDPTPLKSITTTTTTRIDPGTLTSREPQYDFVMVNDGSGIDPEVMLISTHNAVYVVVRGTDRVANTSDPLNYEWGEWIKTNGLAFLQNPCDGCIDKGKIHQGFNSALHYGNAAGTFINTLTTKIQTMAGTTKKIWITGHSLGGAFAQLIGFFLKEYKGITAQQIVIFASPHAGDPQFASTLNSIFTPSRIQRYEFIEDPATKVPGRYMGYGRAGVRHHISKVTSPGNFVFNAGERAGNDFGAIAALISTGLTSFGGACFHHPQWYVTSCYNILSSTAKSQVPNPPTLPTASSEGCLQMDINMGTSGSYIDPGSATMATGTYTIKNARSGKFLIASRSDCPININNCCPVIQRSSPIVADDNKWIIQKVDGAAFTCYTLKNQKHQTVLDADAICANSNNCKVQNCNRLSLGDRRMQEWAFVRMTNGNYKLRCVAGDKYLRVNPDCASSDNCKFLLYQHIYETDEEFILTKIN